MSNNDWNSVETFFNQTLVQQDEALLATLAANQEAGLPAIDVSPAQGKLLHLLARMAGAKRILEIGTLGGYSTIWLARALPEDGKVITLEYEPRHAEVASQNIRRAGLESRVTILVGPALDTLSRLAGSAPFDLIFLDADKKNTPAYLTWALKYSRPGTVIVGDNVVRGGRVACPDPQDEDVAGIRRFLEMQGKEQRLTATAIQTVGAKGWDGFSVAIVE